MSDNNIIKNKKIIYKVIALLILVISICAYLLYINIFASNVQLKAESSPYIYIPTGSDYPTVLQLLSRDKFLINEKSFYRTSHLMSYEKYVKPGRYKLREGMSNRELVALLRSGKQTPVQVTFNNIRTIEQLAQRISNQLEADSTSIVNTFNDSTLQLQNGFTNYNTIAIIIPNTYEFYWNTSAEKFYNRMLKEYKKFWNNKRKEQAVAIGLTTIQVTILASIVEQETQKDSEKNNIAGVYLNRFRKNWRLEADPTLVFAVGDFTIRRVLNEYKLIDSPYNTYKYYGLPPGPICIPGIVTIDAVLNASHHEFMYFCAKDDFSGFHAFAITYDQHLNNARRFQNALSKRGILS